jgi:hypothetical protein
VAVETETLIESALTEPKRQKEELMVVEEEKRN